ncbi:DUF1697 domain-containing protein [Sinorhizobium psoraleae]|uniref:DUF1697 domain-containing protein n=1 Tax=Sinorhizobium psoraleae TaxID=520838 RepID=A0ABT4KC28_9HYPH|nr:DUF1697 domain-containing protein [Sinorhizobium psoraleae]MCZ4089515.1 DUF1697 domain-containing protein [Sinorhizobium psoraleae]
MKNCVALLYSIILGEKRRDVTSDLRAMAERLGYLGPRTLVSTGNVVFDAPDKPLADIEAELEAAFAVTFGRHVDIIARVGEDWRKLAAGNPFPDESEADPTRVHVRVMRSPLRPEVLEMVRGHCSQGERLEIVGGDLWVDFAGKASESKLLGVLTTKRLGVGTFRNWNTVRGLRDMLTG